jgi:hypothetical protein
MQQLLWWGRVRRERCSGVGGRACTSKSLLTAALQNPTAHEGIVAGETEDSQHIWWRESCRTAADCGSELRKVCSGSRVRKLLHKQSF